jgi:dienelactone hydrolase
MREVFQKVQGETSRGVREVRGARAGIVAALATIVGLSLGGCMAYHASDKSRFERTITVEPLTSSDWPARDTTCLEVLRDNTPQEYYRLQLTGEKTIDQIAPAHAKLVSKASMSVCFNEIVGPGLLRVVCDPSQPDPDDLKSWLDIHQGFHPNAWFLSSLTLNDPRRPAILAQQKRFRTEDENGSPHSGVRYSNTDLSTCIKEGIPICFPPIQKTPPRGLLIHFVAMMGNEYENAVMKALREQGWAVIDIDSNPRLMGGGRTFHIDNDHDLDMAARSLGHRVDDVLAEHAYAAEAALEYCRRNRPDLPTGQVCVIGFSAGSLVVPTVAARLGDDVEAAVLIAGGANLLEIAMDSALSDGGIQIKWGKGRGNSADKKALLNAYLACSKLDPYRTAPTLAKKPVLQYWGQLDKWVPAQSGDLLYEQLNHPDKVTFLGGHALLFYFLPTQSGRICDWIDHAMAAPTQALKNNERQATGPVPTPEVATR